MDRVVRFPITSRLPQNFKSKIINPELPGPISDASQSKQGNEFNLVLGFKTACCSVPLASLNECPIVELHASSGSRFDFFGRPPRAVRSLFLVVCRNNTRSPEHLSANMQARTPGTPRAGRRAGTHRHTRKDRDLSRGGTSTERNTHHERRDELQMRLVVLSLSSFIFYLRSDVVVAFAAFCSLPAPRGTALLLSLRYCCCWRSHVGNKVIRGATFVDYDSSFACFKQTPRAAFEKTKKYASSRLPIPVSGRGIVDSASRRLR